MRKLLVTIALVSLSVFCSATATKVNPTTQINWPLITGNGTPTFLGLACTTANYGQPYQNLAVSPNTFYTCGSDGWAQRGGGSGGGGVNTCSTTGAVAYYAASGATVSCDSAITSDGAGTLTVKVLNAAGGAGIASVLDLPYSGTNPSVGAASHGVVAVNSAGQIEVSNNGAAYALAVLAGVDINTSFQVTATHLASALPIAQGGTAGATAVAGLASLMGAPSAGTYNVTCSSGSSCAPSAALVADTTVTVGSGVAFSANTCSSVTGTANTASTVTMTNLTTGMVANFIPTTDVKAVTGWSPGTGGQLYFQAWPSASNTLSYYVCNPTSSTLTTGSSTTWNVSAR